VRDYGIYFIAILFSASAHAAILHNDSKLLYEAGSSIEKNVTVAKIKFKKRKAIPKPPPKEIPKPKPVSKKRSVKPKPEPLPEPEKVEEVLEEVAEVDTEAVERERKHFLSLVMNCIEKCKYYPSSARRRGMNGEVTVDFTLMPNGQVEGIDVVGRHKVLCMAAAEAVKKAQLPTPPGNEPYKVKFVMEYALE